MNSYYKTDAMDLQLYAVMPQLHNKDADIYDAVLPVDLTAKDSKHLMRKLVRRIRYTEQHEIYSPVWEFCKRTAAVVLMVMSIGFASVMSIEAVRDAVWKTVTTWYEERIHIQYVTDHDTDAPATIENYKKPVISDQYIEKEIIRSMFNYHLNYLRDGEKIIYQQGTLVYYDTWLSNHDTEMHKIEIQQYQGYVTESYIDNALCRIMIWHDGSYAYMLYGNVEIPELLYVAETIQ